MDIEFQMLSSDLPKSGCQKKQVAAGTRISGLFVVAVNRCEFEGLTCPRLTMGSGEGYELCRAHHAESELAARLAELDRKSDGIAWVMGHYWACEPCASALKAVGVREIRVRETLE
jgi:deoxycytidylate deaminase